MSKKIIQSTIFFILFLISVYFLSEGKKRFNKTFYYSYDQKAIFGEKEIKDIPPFVLKYVQNRDFVLVKQRPHYIYDELYDYNENYQYKHGLNNIYYWVISKIDNQVIGPLTEDEFDDYLKNLPLSSNFIEEIKD